MTPRFTTLDLAITIPNDEKFLANIAFGWIYQYARPQTAQARTSVRAEVAL